MAIGLARMTVAKTFVDYFQYVHGGFTRAGDTVPKPIVLVFGSIFVLHALHDSNPLQTSLS